MLENKTATYYSNKYPEIFLTRHVESLNKEKPKIPLKSRVSRFNQMDIVWFLIEQLNQKISILLKLVYKFNVVT